MGVRMSDNVDDVEARLRRASGLGPSHCPTISRDRGFLAGLGCGARVEIHHINGRVVGSIGITLRRLSPDAAEAVLNFLRSRNEPNSMYDK